MLGGTWLVSVTVPTTRIGKPVSFQLLCKPSTHSLNTPESGESAWKMSAPVHVKHLRLTFSLGLLSRLSKGFQFPQHHDAGTALRRLLEAKSQGPFSLGVIFPYQVVAVKLHQVDPQSLSDPRYRCEFSDAALPFKKYGEIKVAIQSPLCH
jgi:hypothetical protein